MSNEGLAKLQGLAQSTAATIRSASFKMRESLNQAGGVSEYSQKLAANVVNKGVPSMSDQLQQFFALLWRRLIQFLESKGLKEPLERNYEKFRGLPIVQYLLKLFADLLKVLFKSQFVQKVMGGERNREIVEEEKKGEGEEEMPVNGMKQEAPYTVMEALQKAAPSATSTAGENGGTQNIVQPSQNINEQSANVQKVGNEQPANDQKVMKEQVLAVEPKQFVQEQKIEVQPQNIGTEQTNTVAPLKVENQQVITPEQKPTKTQESKDDIKAVKEQKIEVQPKKVETEQKIAVQPKKIETEQKIAVAPKKPQDQQITAEKKSTASLESQNDTKASNVPKVVVQPKKVETEQKVSVTPKQAESQKITPEQKPAKTQEVKPQQKTENDQKAAKVPKIETDQKTLKKEESEKKIATEQKNKETEQKLSNEPKKVPEQKLANEQKNKEAEQKISEQPKKVDPDYKGEITVYLTNSPSTRKVKEDIVRMKHILSAKKMEFKEVDLMENPEKLQVMKNASYQNRNLPQLHLDGKYVGDADLVFELEDFGELGKILKGEMDLPISPP